MDYSADGGLETSWLSYAVLLLWFVWFPSFSSTTMFISSLVPLFACTSLVAAGGVHKLKLNKLPPTLPQPEQEATWLSEKYGGNPSFQSSQMPLMGAGGSGRQVRPSGDHDDGLYWTQDMLKGGHSVPLSSKSYIDNEVEQYR